MKLQKFWKWLNKGSFINGKRKRGIMQLKDTTTGKVYEANAVGTLYALIEANTNGTAVQNAVTDTAYARRLREFARQVGYPASANARAKVRITTRTPKGRYDSFEVSTTDEILINYPKRKIQGAHCADGTYRAAPQS